MAESDAEFEGMANPKVVVQCLTLADLKAELRAFAQNELRDAVKYLEAVLATCSSPKVQTSGFDPFQRQASGPDLFQRQASPPYQSSNSHTQAENLTAGVPREGSEDFIKPDNEAQNSPLWNRQISKNTENTAADSLTHAARPAMVGTKKRHLQGFVQNLDDTSNHSEETIATGTKKRLSTSSLNTQDDLNFGDGLSDEGEDRTWTHVVKDVMESLLHSSISEHVIAFLIVGNAIALGVQADLPGESYILELLEIFFCIFFTAEFLLRLTVNTLHGKNLWDFFCRSRHWTWNIFDAFLVGHQLSDMILRMFLRAFENTNNALNSVGAFRTVRTLRLVRILRVVRIMRFVRDLRTLLASITNSFGQVFWTLATLFLLMYAFGVFFTQSVGDFIRENKGPSPHDLAQDEILQDFFGSTLRSMLTLFECVTGGVDWRFISNAMIERMNPLFSIALCMYIVMVVFCLVSNMNGLFVEVALRESTKDNDLRLLHLARELFVKVDVDCDGKLTWDEFKSSLYTGQMQKYFQVLDLDVREAKTLFDLIDVDESGEIDANEFVNGCFRLRGNAKAIEFANFYRDFDVMRSEFNELATAWKRNTTQMEHVWATLGFQLSTFSRQPTPSFRSQVAPDLIRQTSPWLRSPPPPATTASVHDCLDNSGIMSPPSTRQPIVYGASTSPPEASDATHEESPWT